VLYNNLQKNIAGNIFVFIVRQIESVPLRLAELVELNDEPFVVLNCRCAVAKFVDIEPRAVLHFARIASNIVGQRFPTAYAATAGHAARVVETVNDLFQLRFGHRVFRVFHHFAEDEATQLRQVLRQFAPLLLGEVIRKNLTPFYSLSLTIPCISQNQILTVDVELVSASDRKQYLNLDQLVFLRRAHAIQKFAIIVDIIRCEYSYFYNTFILNQRNFLKFPDLTINNICIIHGNPH